MKLKDMLDEEKPREKLKRLGIEYLTDSELLSILLRTGNKNESVNVLSSKILKSIGGIKKLKEVSLNTLCKIEGIKLSKASVIVAAFELAKRSYKEENYVKFKSVKDMYNFIRSDFVNVKQEKFLILLFDTKMNLIKKKELFKGTINEVNIYAREIFKEALNENASFIVLIHNHPSGDVSPSEEDDITTKKLVELGKFLGVKIIDHLLVSQNNYFSYYENMKKNIIIE